MKIEAHDLDVTVGTARIIDGLDFTADSGRFVGVIGPNGSGKSTFLKTLHRALRPFAGTVRIGGDDPWALPAREAARRTAAVLQHDDSEFTFSVRETVETGRVPHRRLFERMGAADRTAVDEALAVAGVAHLAERMLGTLSGGERQRVLVARALAQAAPVMVLDEPTNHLDVAAQIDLLALLAGLRLTVVAALHELNLAAAHCDELYLLAGGRLVAHGPPAEVLVPSVLERVYGVRAHCGVNPLTGRPAISFAPRAPSRPPHASEPHPIPHPEGTPHP